MPTSLCLEAPCANPATYRGRCAVHNRTRNQATSPNRSIYNRKRWHNTRKHQLHLHPICQHCNETLASEVHHVKAIQDGGDPWSMDNLASLCKACHSSETRREQATR